MNKLLKSAVALALAAMLLAGCTNSPPAKELTRGTVDKNVYTSEFAQITFTAPEGWEYADDESLAELMGVAAEALSNSELKVSKEILESRTIYDAMAINPMAANVIFMYDNLGASLGTLAITEQRYLEIMKDNLQTANLQTYVFEDIREEKAGAHTCKAMYAQSPDFGLWQLYAVRRIGKYMHCIIVTSTSKDDIPGIMANVR